MWRSLWTLVSARTCNALLATLLACFATTSDAHFVLTAQSCAGVASPDHPPTLLNSCTIGVRITPDEITQQSGSFSAGGFFTLYDVGPLVGGVAGIGHTGALTFRWNISSELTDTPAPGTAPFDDPSIANVRFLCGNCGGFSGVDVGTFTLLFADPFPPTSLVYDSDAFDLTTRAQVARTGVLTLAVPEPRTSGLIGLGLLVMGSCFGARRLRHTRSKAFAASAGIIPRLGTQA